MCGMPFFKRWSLLICRFKSYLYSTARVIFLSVAFALLGAGGCLVSCLIVNSILLPHSAGFDDWVIVILPCMILFIMHEIWGWAIIKPSVVFPCAVTCWSWIGQTGKPTFLHPCWSLTFSSVSLHGCLACWGNQEILVISTQHLCFW